MMLNEDNLDASTTLGASLTELVSLSLRVADLLSETSWESRIKTQSDLGTKVRTEGEKDI
jgi:hypothetical protein